MTTRREVLLAGAGLLAGCARPAATAASALASTRTIPVATGATAPAPTLRAKRLAWAGVRLEVENASLWIDPLSNADVWGPALREPLVPLSSDAARRYALVTHRHPDHFDPLAIAAVHGSDGVLVCASETATIAAARGLRVRPAALYEPVLLGDDFVATAVPAVDGYGDPQVSWVVRGGGRRIVHCGDTMWHGAWWHIARQLGPFDAAFLPINGARFAWRKPVTGMPAVMTPEQAVAAAVVLGARVLVPIHYGVVGAEGYEEVAHPETLLATAARERAVSVQIVAPGGWV